MSTTLHSNYSVLLSLLTESAIAKHCKNLTLLFPFDPNNSVNPPLILWKKTRTHLLVPKFYGLKHFGPPDHDYTQVGRDINLTFHGSLWNDPVKHNFNQAPVAEKVLTHFEEKKHGGLLCLPTGSGKTQMAMYFICEVAKQTLIVVHSNMLMTQWEERIATALPDAKIGHIQGKNIDVKGKDIVLAMIHSLAQITYPAHIFQNFGLVICDEVHIMAARSFSTAIWKFAQVKFILGLSATPHRKDKMEQVLYIHMGPMIHRASPATNTSRKVSVRVTPFDFGNRKIVTLRNGKCNNARMITLLTQDRERNEFIRDIVRSLLVEDRSILAISERILHLTELTDWVHDEFKEKKAIHYHANLDKQDRLSVDQNKYNWIAATYSLFSAGMDISSIDTILFLTPRRTVMQVVGRIRNASGPNPPLIVDIVDTFGCFSNQIYARQTVYAKKEFKVIGKMKRKKRKTREWEEDSNADLRFSFQANAKVSRRS